MMGDYFTRLAERALGLAPVVQPDLMPVVLAAADAEPASAAISQLGESGERAPSPARKLAPTEADWQTRNIGATASVTAAGDTAPGLRQSERSEAALPPRVSGAGDWQLEASNRQSSAVEPPITINKLAIGEKTAPAEIRQSPQTDGVIARPHLSEARPAAAPTIQIAIGTVEIRAVTPAPTAAPPRPAERRVAARLSLEEYLRQRHEGQR